MRSTDIVINRIALDDQNTLLSTHKETRLRSNKMVYSFQVRERERVCGAEQTEKCLFALIHRERKYSIDKYDDSFLFYLHFRNSSQTYTDLWNDLK